jgi:copper homeostasis protein CutC
MKRMYTETQKYKNNSAKRKLRIKDRLEQDKENKQFNVMVRAKLRKQRIHTIITPDELSRFHKNLRNVLIMHFITEERKKKEKKIVEKKISNTQKRKIEIGRFFIRTC